MTAKKQVQLRPKSWRYRLVCLLGYLLWGRPLAYLSWWEHGTRSAGVLLFYQGKLLMVKRRNIADKPGKWSIIGGFVDAGETFAEGLVREIREETGLVFDPARFPPESMFSLAERYVDLAEMRHLYVSSATYICHLTVADLQALAPGHETADIKLLDEATIRRWHAEGLLAFDNEFKTICAAFARSLHLPPQTT